MRNFTFSPKSNGDINLRPSIKLQNKILDIILVICLIFCFVLLYINETYYSAQVIGSSMYPTINSYENVSNNKHDIAYYTIYRKPNKNDLIIVNYTKANASSSLNGNDLDAIKRLIAVGGDTICYYGGHILVNGSPINESYLELDYLYLKNKYGQDFADDWKDEGYNTSKYNFERWCRSLYETNSFSEYQTEFFNNFSSQYSSSIKLTYALDGSATYTLTLPKGFVYFLGDNRRGSTDSSIIGPIEQKYVLAKVEFVTDANTNIFQHFWKEFLSLFK